MFSRVIGVNPTNRQNDDSCLTVREYLGREAQKMAPGLGLAGRLDARLCAWHREGMFRYLRPGRGSASGGATLIQWLFLARYPLNLGQNGRESNDLLKDSGRLAGFWRGLSAPMRVARVPLSAAPAVPKPHQVCYQMVNEDVEARQFGSHYEDFH